MLAQFAQVRESVNGVRQMFLSHVIIKMERVEQRQRQIGECCSGKRSHFYATAPFRVSRVELVKFCRQRLIASSPEKQLVRRKQYVYVGQSWRV